MRMSHCIRHFDQSVRYALLYINKLGYGLRIVAIRSDGSGDLMTFRR